MSNLSENRTTQIWVLKEALQNKALGASSMREQDRPPRKRIRKHWELIEVNHKECLQDFAGNSSQAGCWLDAWTAPNDQVIVSIGGFWESYESSRPPRHRSKTRNRRLFHRLPTWVSREDPILRNPSKELTVSIPKDWVEKNGGIVLPPSPGLQFMEAEAYAYAQSPKPSNHVLHPYALGKTSKKEMHVMRDDLSKFIEGTNPTILKHPKGYFRISRYEPRYQWRNWGVLVEDIRGDDVRSLGVMSWGWMSKYFRMQYKKGLWDA